MDARTTSPLRGHRSSMAHSQALARVIAIVLWFPGLATAMQPCRDGTVLCPSPLQVLLLIVLPTTAVIVVLRRLQASAQSNIARYVLAALLTAVLVLWLLLVMAAFSMFLAPCDTVCWLRPGTW
jgi:hypothetical protein